MNRKFLSLLLFAAVWCHSICKAKFHENDDKKRLETCSTSQRLNKHFPKNFIWGAGSSSYQIEGAWNVSGKGLSIWDYSTHNYPEKFINAANGDVAAKSYFLYKEDVKALKAIGMTHHRFSICWPRILPNGDLSEINELGLQHYDDFINELLANGIQPLVTIFHYELPQKLEEIGGMLNPVIVKHFVNYAEILFKRYGDRVKLWGTINEPMIFCGYGYGTAGTAPFVNSSGVGDYICGHHALLAHAKIYHLYHNYYNQDKAGKIGLIIASNFYYPTDPKNPEDVKAAYRTLQFWLGWFAHPIFSKTGGYPKLMENAVRENSRKENLPVSRLPSFTDSEKRLIRGTSDYFFLNYYSSNLVTPANASDTAAFPSPSFSRDLNTVLSVHPDWVPSAASFFYLVPEGLRDILKFIKEEYGNPTVIITENGWADSGGLNDIGRQTFLKTHLQSVLDAVWEDGCRVNGHFTWAIIDTFEFSLGFTIKFGLYEVDYDSPNKTRTAKDSSKLLRQIIKSGKLPK